MKKQQKRRDLRLLWSTNSPWSFSGYGTEAGYLFKRLVADGWPVACSAFFGLQGSPIDLDGVRYYPSMNEPYGGDAMYHHAKDFGAHVVIPFQDLPPINNEWLQKVAQERLLIPYVPIDKNPVPLPVVEKLSLCSRIITFSQFGHDELLKARMTSTLILEGTDVSIFQPMDKMECRKELGLNLPPDAILFGMIAANKENPPRKGFQEVVEAFKLFHDKHPNAYIFFANQQVAPTGYPIFEHMRSLGLSNNAIFLDGYVATYKGDSHKIAQYMNAFDVYLQPSQTEGFGLTAVEAQSCGTPVIVNNSTSQPETVIDGKTGAICNVSHRRMAPDLGYVDVADITSLYEKMELVYKMVVDNDAQVTKDCRAHVMKKYNIDTIFKDKWVPYLEDLQDEILPIIDKPLEK